MFLRSRGIRPFRNPHLRLIALVGLIVPSRLRADWRQEWEAELRYREAMLADWERLDWQSRLHLLQRSTGAFWDALWLQHLRLEEEVFQDLRYGARMLLKKPGFTIITVLMLALGIGANTSIFSVVNGVLLKPLPYHAPEELIRAFERTQGQPKFPMALGNFQDYREQNTTLATLALFTRSDVDLTRDNIPERLTALGVTGEFFDVLGAQPLLGRAFRRGDELPENNAVAIFSNSLWQRDFDGDPGIIGKTVNLSGRPFTVVGVMQPGLQHVGGDYRSLPHGESVDVWWPLELRPQAGRGAHFCNAVGRMKTGVSVAQAEADFNVIASRLAQQYPRSNEGWGIRIEPLHEELVGSTRTTLWVLLGAVFFVLLIACVNVANLLLARATAREREMAVRSAMGAGRARIVRQLLTEGLLLAGLGGVAGITLAFWAIRALRALGPEQLPRLQSVSIDGRILLFTLALSLVTGILFGLAPALQAGRINLNELLKEGGRSASRGMRLRRLRDALVIVEVALALVLMVGAGLLMRGFWKLQQADPGFSTEGVLTASLTLPGARYREPAKSVAFQEQLLDRLAALPGVQAAGLTSDLPWTGYDENAGFNIEGRTSAPNDGPGGRYHYSSPDYFRAVGIPLIAGRFFTRADRVGAQRVVLINQSLASRYWPGESAVGKRFTFSSQPKEADWFNIVGVVGDVKDFPASASAVPAFYWPVLQQTTRQLIVAVRANAPSSMADRVRNEVRALDPDLPLADVRTLETISSAAVAGQRFTLWLVGLFALIALVLAAVGIYSVLSYLVAQRTQEIGIRVALGARTSDVLRLVIGQGMTLALGGVALGVVGALCLTGLMQKLLYGLSATDPWTFSAIALLLTVVALVACYLPARRAARVDPMTALRDE
ncbi:MAG: ABC transporter permease [Acidobacteriota bacterium]